MTFSILSQEKRSAFILDDIDPFFVASAMFDPLDLISPHLVDIAFIPETSSSISKRDTKSL
jgi:hypothetical protein